MRYLTTRDIFLSTINKETQINESTFTNDITFGGSLLGRLVNSIIRKAKVEINYKKVEPIAKEIEDELNKLLFSTIKKEEQEKARAIITKALLEEIYTTVMSDVNELDKINQLLDKPSDDGLITLAIKYIKASPADADYGKGDRDTLISQLEKFKSELEALKEELTKGSESEDKEDAEKKDIEKIILSKLFKGLRNIKPHLSNIKELSESNDKVEIVKFGQQLMVNKSTVGKPLTYDQLIQEDMIFNNAAKAVSLFSRLIIPLNSSEFINYEKTNPIFKQIEQFVNVFGQTYTKMVNMYDSKNKTTSNAPTGNVNASYLFLKYSHFITEDKEQGASVGKKYPAPAKQETGLTTTNKNKEIALNQETGLVTTDKSKETGLVTTDKPEIKKQEITAEPATAEQEEFYNLTIKLLKETLSICYTLLKTQEPKGDFNTSKKVKNKATTENTNFSFYAKYGKIYEDENSQDETQPAQDNTQNEAQPKQEKTGDKVQVAWSNNFKKGEENEWRLNMDQANKVAADIDKNTKPLTDDELREKIKNDNTKDPILRISDLFGKAYRCYATKNIPSNRPGGRVSPQTFREYKYIGDGEAPSYSPEIGPNGPWANIRVFNNFTDKISDLIENTKYRKIFNAGAINRTDGKPTSGNVLLEFIRNMIDENTLKSYEKNRSKLLNKYFGLVGNTEHEPDVKPQQPGAATTLDANTKVKWAEIYKISETKGSDVGSFIAINVTFKFKDNKDNLLKDKHKLIVGQIMMKKDNKILLKWQYNNESIAETYGGKITAGNNYIKTNKIGDIVYVGLIDLSRLEKDSKGQETKNIIYGKPFTMVYYDINKINDKAQSHYTHFTPSKKEIHSDVIRAGSLKNAISVLTAIDDKGDETILKGKINEVNINSINKDKKINMDNVFGSLAVDLTKIK